MTQRTIGAALCATLASAGALAARPQSQTTPPSAPLLLHPMFQDRAILQRDRPIVVYGETTPGAPVTVTLGTAGVEARAGSDGRWSATLPAMPAGAPYTLTAAANGDTRSATDVLVGDVFFCSGQSNMAFSQRQAAGSSERGLRCPVSAHDEDAPACRRRRPWRRTIHEAILQPNASFD